MNLTRVPSSPVNVATIEHPVRARLGNWPHDASVAHVVLLDHHMVPDGSDVANWIRAAKLGGATSIRTGALFPESAHAFGNAGFVPIETLRLLEINLGPETAPTPPPRSVNALWRRNAVRRLRFADLREAATVDGLAFESPWQNDSNALAEICRATPHYRSRSIANNGRMVAFSISGRTSSWGYIQRVAVDPNAQRQGSGRTLIVDALEWMVRRKVHRAMVNTAADNQPAISLYHSLGFETRPEPLVIYERRIVEEP